jgi:hypothetical protein
MLLVLLYEIFAPPIIAITLGKARAIVWLLLGGAKFRHFVALFLCNIATSSRLS